MMDKGHKNKNLDGGLNLDIAGVKNANRNINAIGKSLYSFGPSRNRKYQCFAQQRVFAHLLSTVLI